MNSFNLTKSVSTFLLLLLLAFSTTTVNAQKIVKSTEQTAGFRYATDDSAKDKIALEPVIIYQQNIHMLANIDDRPALTIYGDGRVLVHYPVYMKRAGDHEMRLDEAELVDLVQSFSGNGVMDFDEKKVNKTVRDHKKKLKSKGQYYEISDAVETSIDIRLDEYQKNSSLPKLKDFRKTFKWKNIEQDASRYKDNTEISKANNSVSRLKALMQDKRLIKRGQH